MRILHIVRQFPPAVGGLENFVYCLASSQLKAGLEPEVLTLNTVFHGNGTTLPARDTVDGVPVTRIGWVGSYKYPIAALPPSLLRGFDVIHVHAVDFFADYLPLIRPLHRTPLVLSTHGGFFHTGYASRFKRLFFNTVTRVSVRGYKRVVACSEGDFSLFSPLCRPWLQLVENGVDIEKFAGLGAPDYRPHFLFIGRFSDNKRLDLLLETFHRLAPLVPDSRLTIIGRDWDGNLAKMTDQVQALKLGARVGILPDLSDAEIRARIGESRFIISASDYEGFGMTLVEGMAAGLVPVASPITSFERIVESARTGLLVDFHHPESAARRIHAFLQQTAPSFGEVRAKSISAARRYGWTETATRFQRIYDDILGSRRRTSRGVAIDTRPGDAIVREIE